MSALPWLLRLLAMLALLAGAVVPARADSPIALWKTFDGRVNFTGTQVSLRTRSNNVDACKVSSSSTDRTAVLALPVGATVLSAQLYWAGSGAADNTVTFEGNAVTASRKYSSATVGGGFNYFGGAADVTSVVKAKGSGTYTFSGLTISIGKPWCASQAVLGGFSLLVVYAHPNEPERVLNLYEGFRYVQNSEVVVSASNFRWNRTAWPVRERARIGHITWEGDPTLAQDGERLLFEGNEVSDTLNPEGNQFNSRSNINNDSASHGIDFDAYDTSVVIWAWYDARVTTTYRTGQDLVLLNAEILVVPTMPVSDLSVELTRSGPMQAGKNTSYTVALTNKGPYTEAGPVTASLALPAGVSYVSSSGSGWTCSAATATTSGQAVSCTWRAALAPDTSATSLVITAAVASAGSKTASVSVKGTDDDDLANNTASNTATALAADPNPSTGVPPGSVSASYVFTDKECTPGVKIVPGTASCQFYTATPVAMTAGRTRDVFITALDAAGVPAALGETAKLSFSLRCVNPVQTARVQASFAGTTLPACAPASAAAAPGSTWSSEVAIAFPKDKASVSRPFSYPDVGIVELSLLSGGATALPATFVSKPDALAFRRISAGGVAVPETADVTAPEGLAFAMAGEEVLVELGARVFSASGVGDWAPNFGNEKQRPAVVLSNEDLHTDANLSNSYLKKKLALGVDADSWSAADGTISVKTSWGEAGATRFVASLANYLDAGAVGTAKQDVGRFYPAYFSTEVSAPFPCLPGVACPKPNEVTLGVAYAKQPFDVKVVPRNLNDVELENYTGKWVRPITLGAVSDPGPDGVSLPGLAPAALPAGGLSGKPHFDLALPYASTAPRDGKWTRPATIYVRATSSDERVAPGGKVAIHPGSNRAPAASDEGGLVVVNGRLKVANALGTELLRTPVRLRVEYWPDAGEWLGHAAYASAVEASAGVASFTTCTGDLVLAGSTARPPPCDSKRVAADAAKTVKLDRGAGTLWLQAVGKPAAGQSGNRSISLLFPGWDWLPSTLGRVSFGAYRSPVIYLRELY